MLKPTSRKKTSSSRKKVKTTKGLLRKDRLLNTGVRGRPELLRISAQLNSTESPLLRLPGELRDKIWRYALGDHQIDIQDWNHKTSTGDICGIQTAYPDVPRGFVSPTFQLPRVCRQIYCEASKYIYTENTFAFRNIASLDKWIKNRCIGQRRLVMSLDVPHTYTRLYRSGLRKTFTRKFPNLQRIGLDNWTLFCDYDKVRRLPESKSRIPVEMWSEARAAIINEVQRKERVKLRIDWHGKSA